MHVTVYGPLRSATGAKTVTLDVGDGDQPVSVADVLDAFVSAYPRSRPQLFADDGSVRGSVRVAADGDRVTPDDTVSADAALSLHPAVQGG